MASSGWLRFTVVTGMASSRVKRYGGEVRACHDHCGLTVVRRRPLTEADCGAWAESGVTEGLLLGFP